jgi:hypothetical protein
VRLKRTLPALLAAAAMAAALGVPSALAAGAPEVTATWVTTVTTNSANLRAEVDPNGLSTTYHFEYVTNSAFQVSGFAGAVKAPAGADVAVGSGETPVAVLQHIGGLTPATSYRYRVVANNGGGTATGPTRPLQTDEVGPVFSLPDGRGWEVVSPLDKNGGQIAAPEALFGGGVLQAAAQGGAVTYGSASSFGSAEGAPGASQYLSRRSAGGWSTENVTLPLLAGSDPPEADGGVPFRLFSGDLAGALVANGGRYYLRDNTDGSLAALPSGTEVAGASDDLAQVVLSSQLNLYRYSAAGLEQINILPGDSQGTPGATLAAGGGAGALSPTRAYFELEGNLYLREGGETEQVDAGAGGGGSFEAASADGTVAFFTKAGHLYRHLAPAGSLTDLTPGGGVQGVLGASADGSAVYYLTAAGLFRWNQGATTEVAAAADASNYPPATGAARVSADGSHLAFLSSVELSGYDSAGNSEVYLYSATADSLTCASCNPSGERPLGPSSIPGAVRNGLAIQLYKPRVLSADGNRLFFDSADSLVPQDTDNEPDVYQWEAQGKGSCATAGGCVNLISSGRSDEGATFLDASADGSDIFFLTDGSLVAGDQGAIDVYDARVGGGFPVPEPPIPCVGDACQPVPGEVDDPTPATALTRPEGNPPLRFAKEKKQRKKHKHRKHRKHGHHQKKDRSPR